MKNKVGVVMAPEFQSPDHCKIHGMVPYQSIIQSKPASAELSRVPAIDHEPSPPHFSPGFTLLFPPFSPPCPSAATAASQPPTTISNGLFASRSRAKADPLHMRPAHYEAFFSLLSVQWPVVSGPTTSIAGILVCQVASVVLPFCFPWFP